MVWYLCLQAFSGVSAHLLVVVQQLAVAPGLVKASEQVDVRVVVVECVDEGPSYGGFVYSFSSILALA
jgi:CTP:molybdopterin cytidylyltransferase MocA